MIDLYIKMKKCLEQNNLDFEIFLGVKITIKKNINFQTLV